MSAPYVSCYTLGDQITDTTKAAAQPQPCVQCGAKACAELEAVQRTAPTPRSQAPAAPGTSSTYCRSSSSNNECPWHLSGTQRIYSSVP